MMLREVFPCCEHCADDSIHDVPKDGHSLSCSLCEDEPRQRAEAEVRRLRYGIAARAGDWQANGNSRELGDPTAHVWHKAARSLLDLLDGTP
jgi:hypothetical protein